jgi:hypothetical protein
MAPFEVRFEKYGTFFIEVGRTGEVTHSGSVSVAGRHVVGF